MSRLFELETLAHVQ